MFSDARLPAPAADLQALLTPTIDYSTDVRIMSMCCSKVLVKFKMGVAGPTPENQEEGLSIFRKEKAAFHFSLPPTLAGSPETFIDKAFHQRRTSSNPR